MKIFISYAHIDEAAVRELVEILRDGANHNVWFDPHLIAGKAWENQLLEAIQACDCFLYALTLDSIASKWCQWEFAQAVHAGKPILPVKMQSQVVFNDVLDILNRVQYVDFCQGATVQSAVRLVSSVDRAGTIPSDSVPLLPTPQSKPERFKTSRVLADQLYAKACPLYLDRQFDQARELLEDCLSVEPDHADAKKLLELIIRKIERGTGVDTGPLVLPEVKEETTPWFLRPENNPTQRVEDVLPPPFEWVQIPAGKVILYEIDSTKRIEDFTIAKYPITNTQYQVFIDAKNGYHNPQWWDYSPEANRWWLENGQTVATAFAGQDLPRTRVCWYEAVAFCRWLSKKTGERILLPTVVQWQRAAQGDHRHDYPWGDENPNRELCNFNQQVGQPTPVTQYPKGASPFGVMDMSGNVWEWCLNELETNKVKLAGNARRVVRGGSWVSDENSARIDHCLGFNPGSRSDSVGFRVALFPRF